MFPKVSPFISKLLREWLLFKVEKDIEEIKEDLHEILEWEANQSLLVADRLSEINHRLTRIEKEAWKGRWEENAVSSGE